MSVQNTNRTLAAKVMDHPAVVEMLNSDLDQTVRALLAATDLPVIYKLQARAGVLQQFLTDIQNVRK